MENVWSDWIEWYGGECPIPDAKRGEWQIGESGHYLYEPTFDAFHAVYSECWKCGEFSYRVKLTDRLEPTPEEVEATQLPETPETDEAADLREMNAAMLARDLVEPKPKAVRAVVVHEPEPWHLRVSAWTNRLGGWNAEA